MTTADPTALDNIADHLINDATLMGAASAPGYAWTTKNVRPGPPVPSSTDQSEANAVPADAVFIRPTGGLPVRQGRVDDVTEEASSYQLLIRSKPQDFDAGHLLALAVYGAMLRPPAGFFRSEVFGGPPSWIEQDAQGHHLFVVNVMLWRTRA